MSTDTHDVFPSQIKSNNIVALVEDTTIETVDKNITVQYKRGLYSFTNYKEARKFATLVNQMLDTPIAFRFQHKPEQMEN